MSNPIEGAESVVTRGQNQLHIVAEEWQLAGDILEPLLDRLDPAVASTQLVILAGDAESAAGLSGRLVRAADERKLRTLAATDVRRAARVLKAGPAHVLVTHPAVLIDLTQRSSLKLDGARVVVLAWVDSLSASGTRALESVMAELPKDAARVVLAAHATPEVEQLVERYARRARRVLADGGETLSPVAVSYVTTAESGKLDALRRVLDALDPDSATVVARLAASREAASALLRSLGYHDTTVRVASAADASASTVIFHDFPTDDNDVRRAGRARIVALVTARQLASLRRMAGGTVTPFALPEAAARAQSREDALRAELRAVLETCQFGRELIALESLLADYDGSAAQAGRTGGPINGHAQLNVTGAGPGFGVHCVDLKVDEDTGCVSVGRYTAAQDVGTAIHPSYVEGQLQGGAVQGIGWALNEEYIYNAKGKLDNPGFLDYRMPVASDLPMIETILVEVPNPQHPYGVRGVGEVPIVPPIAAVGNAIARATGVRMVDLPMSPPRLSAALDAARPMKMAAE